MLIFNYDFSYIIDKYDLNTVSLSDIKQILRNVSLNMVSGDNTITAFADNADTYLYSGIAVDGLSSNMLVKNIENARIIDKSEAGYLLQSEEFHSLIQNAFINDVKSGRFTAENIKEVEKGIRRNEDLDNLKNILSKSDMTQVDATRAAKIAMEGYLYEPTKGAWATISERFVEETPSGSNIYCVTANADLNRTWGQVEVIKVLDVMPEDKVIGNTTVGELAGHLINAALGPYLVAIGTVALGPVGALLGGLAAGMISYGLA